MKWCSTYLYRSTQKRRARDMIKLIDNDNNKFMMDLMTHGTSYTMNGQHIPIEEVRLEHYESEDKH